jgi:cytidine deaminase
MIKKEIHFTVDVFKSIEDLQPEDKALLSTARETTQAAYAPYSNFLVGAVAHLVNGAMVKGTNQENASYPVGLCAERVLLSSISSQFSNIAIQTMAISYHNLKGKSDYPISPCGMCRQSLVEYEQRVKQSFRIILSGMTGEVYIIEKASDLLPLPFSANDLASSR